MDLPKWRFAIQLASIYSYWHKMTIDNNCAVEWSFAAFMNNFLSLSLKLSSPFWFTSASRFVYVRFIYWNNASVSRDFKSTLSASWDHAVNVSLEESKYLLKRFMASICLHIDPAHLVLIQSWISCHSWIWPTGLFRCALSINKILESGNGTFAHSSLLSVLFVLVLKMSLLIKFLNEFKLVF